jgi:uncharacterized membrane protein YeaQ/YmgE (transglycosylase-associated protein family)
MFTLLSWLIYGLIVGYIAKKLHPGEDPVGFLPTLGIGVAGSFIGGFLHWAIGFGGHPFQSSGIIFGILGGVIACVIWRQIKIQQFIKIQGRAPKMFVSKEDREKLKTEHPEWFDENGHYIPGAGQK